MSTADLRAFHQQLSARTDELSKQMRDELRTRPGASPEHRKYHELFVAEDKAFFELQDAYRARYGATAPLVDPYGNYPNPTDLPEDLAAMLAKFRELTAQKLQQRQVLQAKFGDNRWQYFPPSLADWRANRETMEQIYKIIVYERGEGWF